MIVPFVDDPASAVYVRGKRRACEEVGINSFAYDLPAATAQAQTVAAGARAVVGADALPVNNDAFDLAALLRATVVSFGPLSDWHQVVADVQADLPLAQRVLSLLLRTAFVATLAFGLARLARTATTQKVCTVYVVDVSDSVPDAASCISGTQLTTSVRGSPIPQPPTCPDRKASARSRI